MIRDEDHSGISQETCLVGVEKLLVSVGNYLQLSPESGAVGVDSDAEGPLDHRAVGVASVEVGSDHGGSRMPRGAALLYEIRSTRPRS